MEFFLSLKHRVYSARPKNILFRKHVQLGLAPDSMALQLYALESAFAQAISFELFIAPQTYENYSTALHNMAFT